MTVLLAIAAMLVPALEADALRETAPADLSPRGATEHLAAARLAAAAFDVDPADLLAIAWHESRYTAGVVTREPGGRVSCGALTPEPKRSCEPWEMTTLGGYLAGAAHLREWYRVCRGHRPCALHGYGGRTWDRQGSRLPIGAAFAARAARIRHAIGGP